MAYVRMRFSVNACTRHRAGRQGCHAKLESSDSQFFLPMGEESTVGQIADCFERHTIYWTGTYQDAVRRLGFRSRAPVLASSDKGPPPL